MRIFDDVLHGIDRAGGDALCLGIRENCRFSPCHQPGSHERIDLLRILLGDLPPIPVPWLVEPTDSMTSEPIPLGQLRAVDTYKAVLTFEHCVRVQA